MAEPGNGAKGDVKQERGARDVALSHACWILCPTVVSNIKVRNPTLHSFFDSDTPNNKRSFFYQTSCSAHLGWIFSFTCEV